MDGVTGGTVVWRTDEPCPVVRGRAVPGRPRRARAGRRVPAVRLVRTLGTAADTTNGNGGDAW